MRSFQRVTCISDLLGTVRTSPKNMLCMAPRLLYPEKNKTYISVCSFSIFTWQMWGKKTSHNTHTFVGETICNQRSNPIHPFQHLRWNHVNHHKQVGMQTRASSNKWNSCASTNPWKKQQSFFCWKCIVVLMSVFSTFR